VARSGSGFISRGDKSGTHAAELRFWGMAGLGDKVGDKVAEKATDKPSPGYRACGCGMGAALNMASSTGAYVLADRGTWLNFKNRGDLAVLVEGDRRLFNQYGVLLVNPAKHPHVKAVEGQKFIDWLVLPAGQSSISSYKISNESVFFPNANK
jgi:tungstate transport system substrate-binding protein